MYNQYAETELKINKVKGKIHMCIEIFIMPKIALQKI